MTYKEQLLHPKWQKRRLDILSRDNYKCVNCGEANKTLHVHHAYYRKNKSVWDYPDKLLYTLCKDCHSMIHSDISYMDYIFQNIDSWYDIWPIMMSTNIYKTCKDPEDVEALASLLIEVGKVSIGPNEIINCLYSFMSDYYKSNKADIPRFMEEIKERYNFG